MKTFIPLRLPLLLIMGWGVSLLAEQGASAAAGSDLLVYIGTYTGEKSQGIYLSRFDGQTGRLTPPELAAEAKNPAFLAAHPKGGFLYAVGELDTFAGRKTGSVSAFRIEQPSGKLTLLNQQPSGGTGPCHLTIDPSGKCVLVANYGSGSVAAFPVRSNGELGEAGTVLQHTGSSVDPKRQTGPHAHQVVVDPKKQRVLACDLGLDQVLVYKLDADKAWLAPNDPAFGRALPGAGPRHLAFHPNGRRAFVLNEMACTLTSYDYDAETGALNLVEHVSILPSDQSKGNASGAELQVHPSGKYVYASNRGRDSIATYSITRKGELKLVGHTPTQGKT
ncbi:MAG TPA: lactonase family protein, partial [Clostridia bacterium]|nr:lactonase family protein [Clostridia bacterium]